MGASNAWAVDGSRSAAGKPLLANDPHLWLSAPGVWYLVDLRGGDVLAPGTEPVAGASDPITGVRTVRRDVEDGPGGGLLCEIGTGRDILTAEFPRLDFFWLDTEESQGEVFWLTRQQLTA